MAPTSVKKKMQMKAKPLAKKAAKAAVKAVKKTALARRAPDMSSGELKRAGGAAQSGLKRAVNSVKEHPVASLGTLIGAGVLVGVAATAIRRNPSVGEAVADAFSNRASKASKALSSAQKTLKKATSSVRRALK